MRLTLQVALAGPFFTLTYTVLLDIIIIVLLYGIHMESKTNKGLSIADPDSLTKARKNQEEFKRAHDAGHDSFVALAQKCDRFYIGQQWERGDKAKLDSQGRPALTLNMVLSTVNAILGEQMDRRMEVRYTPSRAGTDEIAFELNQLTRFILSENRFNDVEDTVFADGVITGRGYYDIRMDYEKNLFGDIAITAEDCVDVIPDPDAKEMDPKTWSRVFISRWMTPDEIAVEYGEEKAELLRQLVCNNLASDPDDVEFYSQTFAGRDYANTEERPIRRVRVIEQQRYESTEALHWVDAETGDFRMVPFHIDEDEATAFAGKNGLHLMKRPVRRVRMIVSADQVLLSHDWSPYRTFTIVPYFPYFRRGQPFGVVENLLDPQELLNKTSSQELHIVNTTANSGWIVEEGSLVNMDETDLEERGAETGLVMVKRRTAASPEKIQPNQIPTGIDRISQKAAQTIRDVSAINTAMLGLAATDQSGRAQQTQVARGQVQVGVVLKNLERCRRNIAEKILELVQDFYTDTRFYQVVHDDEILGKQEQQRFINGVDADGTIINDITRGQYNVDVAVAPAAGSAAEIQFNEAKSLREIGVGIPDFVLVQYSQLRNKRELSELLKSQQGFGDPTPEQQQLQQAEMQNQIAKMERELQEMDAEIEQKRSRAMLDAAKAASLQGYNEAALEVHRMEQERDLRVRELSARIALAAQSHYNQRYLNKFRAGSSIALETLRSQLNKDQQQPEKTGVK